jgi:hypothetical protein
LVFQAALPYMTHHKDGTFSQPLGLKKICGLFAKTQEEGGFKEGNARRKRLT